MDPFNPPGFKFPNIQDMEKETLKRMGLATLGLILGPSQPEEEEEEEEPEDEED